MREPAEPVQVCVQRSCVGGEDPVDLPNQGIPLGWDAPPRGRPPGLAPMTLDRWAGTDLANLRLPPMASDRQQQSWSTQMQVPVETPRSAHESAFPLEDYVKDLHWLIEKIVLVTERSMLMIEEVHRDHTSNPTHRNEGNGLTSKGNVTNETTLPTIFEESQHMLHIDQTIREAVSSMESVVLKSMEALWRDQKDAQSSEIIERECIERPIEDGPTHSQIHNRPECMQLASLGEDMLVILQRELQEHAKRSQAHEDAQKHVLDAMLAKIDSLSSFAHPMPMTHHAPTQYAITHPPEPLPFPSPPEILKGPAMRWPEEATTQVKDNNSSSGVKRMHRQVSSLSLGLTAPHVKQKAKEAADARAENPLSGVLEESAPNQSLIEKVASSAAFEILFGLFIVLSTVKMCVEAEYGGWAVGHKLGKLGIEGIHGTTRATASSSDHVFFILEHMFGIVFTFEVLVKLVAERWKFFRSGWNMFDTFIISLAWFTMRTTVDLSFDPMLFRLVRLVRLLRLLRVLSHYEVLDDLQLMVRSLQAGVPVLAWVVILVGPALACLSLGMNFALMSYIEDDTKPTQHRVTCFNYFGTFSKAMLTMFEVTFSNWVPICRFLYANVDERFAIFFMCYQLLMGIAVLRIIYGVFLHVTFRCVDNNEEIIAAHKARADKKYSAKLCQIFKHYDSSGTGRMCLEDFHKLVKDERVKVLLAHMELDILDAELVFELANEEGGNLSPDEMIIGFGLLKGAARSVDVRALLCQQRKCIDKLNFLQDHFQHQN